MEGSVLMSIYLGNPKGVENIYLMKRNFFTAHIIFGFLHSSHGEDHDLKQTVLKKKIPSLGKDE